jgi:tripartite-type tricarboxylate transporter receptor subunit TctC
MHGPVRITRRSLVASAAALGLPLAATAQSAWPTRTVKIIDAAAPGGSTDVMARMVGSKIGPRLGQTFVVENRTGAGMTLGTDAVAKSPPDGYTLLLTSTAMCTAAASGKKLPYDYLKDLTAVGAIGATPLIIVVPANSPFKTLRDLVEQARAKPDGVSYSSSGIGSMSHIGMELLGSIAKVRMLHVPYKGVSMSITDLIGGQIHAALGTVATYAKLLEGGQMRALVATSPQRSPFLPELPTSIEAGYPEFLIEFWWGLMAPTGTPAEAIRRLNTELNAILAEPDTRETLTRFAATPKPGTAEEFGRLNTFEVARWSKLIKDAGIKVE